jgi:ABC-type glycerol-3-phosphate transport system substrate-binding protein
VKKLFVLLTLVALSSTSCITQNAVEPTSSSTAALERRDAPLRDDVILSPTLSVGKPRETEVVTVRFASYGIEIYEESAQAFHDMYPHIQVELVSAEDVMGQLSTDDTLDIDQTESFYRLLSAADTVAVGAADLTTNVIKQGWVRDLMPFVKADADFTPEDFYPATLKAFQKDGGLWGVPVGASLQVLLYDKQAFEQAGLAYPSPDWDFDAFVTATERLTRYEESDFRYAYAVPGFWPSAPSIFVASMANLVTRDAQGYDVPQLDSPEVILAVQRYTNLALVQGVMPARTSISTTADLWIQEWLEPRRVVMFPSSALNASLFTSFPTIVNGFASEGIGIALYPPGSPTLRVSGYVISDGTQHPEASWLWLKHLTRDYHGYHLPARQSVADAQGAWARWDQEQQEMLRFALQHADPMLASNSAVVLELNAAIDAIFGGLTAEEALGIAQARALESYRTQIQAEPRPIALQHPELVKEDSAVIQFRPFIFDPALPYESLAAAFNEEQAGIGGQIRVKVSDVADPDCFAAPSSFARDDATAGWRPRALALQPLLDADANVDLSTFHFVDAFRSQGELYGLPILAQPEVLFYNTAIFDEAGIAYPTPDWTLDEFYHVVQGLTFERDGQYGFVPLNGAGIDLPLFVALHGAELWDQQGNPRFDSPDVIAAVAWYADLVRSAVPPGMIVPSDETLAQRQTILAEGRAAVWSVLVNAGVPTIIAPWTDDQLGMVPFPGAVAPMGLEGLFINANAPQDHVTGCWAWIKYAAANRTIAPCQGIPARKAALESSTGYKAWSEQTVAESYRALTTYARLNQPNSVQAQAHLAILYEALASIMDGASVDTALKSAQQRTQ